MNNEGWILVNKTWHYFENGKSLCGKLIKDGDKISKVENKNLDDYIFYTKCSKHDYVYYGGIL